MAKKVAVLVRDRPHEALGYDVPANYYKLENMVGLTLNSK